MRGIALAVWEREGRFFLQRRALEAKVLPGLWEFPGGKVEGEESPATACQREFHEELGLQCRVLAPLGDLAHTYAHGAVRLHPLRVEAEGRVRTELAWGWFRMDEVGHLPIPEANRVLLTLLAGPFR